MWGIPTGAPGLAMRQSRLDAFDSGIDAGRDRRDTQSCRIVRAAPGIQMTDEASVPCAEFDGFLFERVHERSFCFCRRCRVLGLHVCVFAPAGRSFALTLTPTR